VKIDLIEWAGVNYLVETHKTPTEAFYLPVSYTYFGTRLSELLGHLQCPCTNTA